MSNDKYILDSLGEPVFVTDTILWAKWFERANRVLMQHNGKYAFVSTVFLAIDHSFGDGPPVLWETMVIGGTHDEYQERYSTKQEALAGHARVVDMVEGS